MYLCYLCERSSRAGWRWAVKLNFCRTACVQWSDGRGRGELRLSCRVSECGEPVDLRLPTQLTRAAVPTARERSQQAHATVRVSRLECRSRSSHQRSVRREWTRGTRPRHAPKLNTQINSLLATPTERQTKHMFRVTQLTPAREERRTVLTPAHKFSTGTQSYQKLTASCDLSLIHI